MHQEVQEVQDVQEMTEHDRQGIKERHREICEVEDELNELSELVHSLAAQIADNRKIIKAAEAVEHAQVHNQQAEIQQQ